MIFEILAWILFSIFIAYLGSLKVKFFNKDRKLKKTLQTIKELKVKTHKGLEDQKEYVRQKSDAGMDFTNTAAAIVVFILLFIFLLLPRINSLAMGLILSLSLSIVAAWGISFMRPAYQDYAIIDTFIAYLYASTFLIYVKFFETPHPLILLIIGVITLWYAGAGV